MTIEEALSSIVDDGINLGAGDFVNVEALKVAADVLRKAIDGNPVAPGHDDQYNIAEMAYNNGYAKGLEDGKPKWIPVSERLPEDDLPKGSKVKQIKVLVAYKTNGRWVTRTQTRVKGYWYGKPDKWDWAKTSDPITHWMPLQEPPKEDTNG